MSREDVTQISYWYCSPCSSTIFPYNHFDDQDEFRSAVAEGMLDCSYKLHEMNKRLFVPFEINDDPPTSLTEVDPDIQFFQDTHYTKNINCDYYIEDTFKKLTNKQCKHQDENQNTCLSLFHLNIKSLPKHSDELEMYLNSLDFQFSFIGLTETWLDSNKCDLYGLPGYVSEDKYRQNRRGGGVSIFIKETIKYKTRSDLDRFDEHFETLFIEIDSTCFNTKKSIIIGVVYRMPDTSIEIFNDYMSDVLGTIEREHKLCYLLGDYNIDLLQHDTHRPTSSWLDVLYSNGVFPLITKPTRVADRTSTLIDNIFTNNFDQPVHYLQGILCTDMSDHYAIFHIAQTYQNKDNQDTFFYRRTFNQVSINKFVQHVEHTDWSKVLNENDTQNSYTYFHQSVLDSYTKCFPLKRVKSQYINKKPWLSMAMKESIKTKNKLYKNRHKVEIRIRNVYSINNIEIN